MATWSSEVGETLLRRRLLDVPVLLYRLGDGCAAVLMGQAFSEEDKPIIEAAYHNLDGTDFWDADPAFLGVDAGGTRARRLLQKRIAQEGEAS